MDVIDNIIRSQRRIPVNIPPVGVRGDRASQSLDFDVDSLLRSAVDAPIFQFDSIPITRGSLRIDPSAMVGEIPLGEISRLSRESITRIDFLEDRIRSLENRIRRLERGE